MEIRIDQSCEENSEFKLHVTLIDDNEIELGLVGLKEDSYITVRLDQLLSAIDFIKKNG